jgi:hypothetical protein
MYADPRKFSLHAKILPRRGGRGVDFGAAGHGVERVDETQRENAKANLLLSWQLTFDVDHC